MTGTPPTGVQRGTLPRREMLCGALLLGAAGVGVLAGCTATGGSGAGGGSASGTGGASPGSPGTVIAEVASVPVGGGTLVTTPDGAAVLVVQPEANTVKAYSARCPHQGSRVQAPENGVMTCPSHGSQFRIADGEVVHGPATQGLDEVPVTVVAGKVQLA
jgi:nitrite reductase/ring-hydroxylating ferredoxin subunit